MATVPTLALVDITLLLNLFSFSAHDLPNRFRVKTESTNPLDALE